MRNYVILLGSVILLSCDNTNYENYYSFSADGWNSDSIVSFKYIVSDTTKKYDLSLKIRHTVDYEFQNLFLFISADKKDTVEIILANKSGKWLGKGVSDVREVEHIIGKERIFAKKGEYELKLEQAMRYDALEKIEDLKEVLDVGLIIVEHND